MYLITLLLFAFCLCSLSRADQDSADAEDTSIAVEFMYVCQSNDPTFLGTFKIDTTVKMDKVHTYTNGNGRSFYRSNGFWYLGMLENWPPDTYFR